MDYLTNEQAKKLARALEPTRIDLEMVDEIIQQFDEAMAILAEEAMKAVSMLCCGDIEELENLDKHYIFGYEPTARKKKRERDRRKVVKRDTASRFRQYKIKERAWATRKRTGKRRREWRGADRL